MFTQDLVLHNGFHDRMTDRQQILAGRLFVVGLVAVTYGLSLVVDTSIFALAVWSFTGFAALFPVIVAALFWRRATKHGAVAAILTVAAFWTYFFVDGWRVPGYTVGDTGVMPVAVIFAASAAVMVIGSLLTRPPDEKVVATFFPPGI